MIDLICRGDRGRLVTLYLSFWFIGRNTNTPPPINNIDRILEEKDNVYNHLWKQLNQRW